MTVTDEGHQARFVCDFFASVRAGKTPADLIAFQSFLNHQIKAIEANDSKSTYRLNSLRALRDDIALWQAEAIDFGWEDLLERLDEGLRDQASHRNGLLMSIAMHGTTVSPHHQKGLDTMERARKEIAEVLRPNEAEQRRQAQHQAEVDYWRERAEKAERRAAAPPPPVSKLDKLLAVLPADVREIKQRGHGKAKTREQLAEANRQILADHRQELEERGVPDDEIEESVERYRVNLEAADQEWAAEQGMT